MKSLAKNRLLYIIIIVFLVKLYLNSLLLAENGDTYDFFKIAYFLRNFDISVESKRMPFLPMLIALFPPKYFVGWGRIIINLFYFGSILIFYKYFRLLILDKLKSEIAKLRNFSISILTTLVFATNIIILENSFYILADAIFLFFNLLFLYLYRKYGTEKIFLLSVVAGLAFYTRPEGLILYISIGILELVKIIRNHKEGKINLRNKETKILLYLILYGSIFLLPYFIRNYILYDKILYSGYLDDEAGFLFTKELLLQRVGNFLFGLGGVWLLPTLYFLFRSSKTKNSFIALIGKLNLEFLVFVAYSTTLILWGPYIRLYSVPISLILIFIFKKLGTLERINIKNRDIVTLVILYLLSCIFYIVIVQLYNHEDLGYRKLGKAISILFSPLVLIYIILYTKKILRYKILLLFVTLTIIIINLAIFTDKFRITRYKYYTIKEATQTYLKRYKESGNLGYDSGSGVENWYIRDFKAEYDYSKTGLPFIEWAKEKNIKYIITTKELGFNDKFQDYAKLKTVKNKTILELESPFFAGSTKLIEIY